MWFNGVVTLGLVFRLFSVVLTFALAAPANALDLSKLFSLPFEAQVAAEADQDLLGLECAGDNRKPLSFMNTMVLGWKSSTPDQFQRRALVKGPITNFFVDRSSHIHFGINLDADGAGDLEVIYNKKFGELPKLSIGMTVTACGDYITVGPRARLPSPLGAIIHWVHYNPGDRDGGKHPHGFLIINKQAFGVSASQRAIAQRYRY